MGTIINVMVGPKGPTTTLKRWLSFFMGVVLLAGGILLYMFLLKLLPGGVAHLELLKEKDIRAGAYFYSEVDEVRSAELYLRDSRNYRPGN
ncbi:MAG: hypothetical protein M1119_04280 [Firmicutes bacterium]|nr:hypothetical protein [Bacillota bacterium]